MSAAPRILLVKTSSLGDVLHNLPVVSDIRHHFPHAQIDWLVEEAFVALPRLHPGVREILPVALRRWRKQLLQASTWSEMAGLRQRLAQRQYDVVIDTQGLLKSAWLARQAQGLRCGFDRLSAREGLAARSYQRTYFVSRGQHAVQRNRQLVAQALGYTLDGVADYGIHAPPWEVPAWLPAGRYVVLLHATSRDDKLWPEAHWIALGQHLQQQGWRSILPWGSAREQARSQRLQAAIPTAITPPRLSLPALAALLGGADGVVGVDTGLAHLAAALDKPTLGLYTSTDPVLTGLHAGVRAVNLGGVDQIPEVATVLSRLAAMMPPSSA